MSDINFERYGNEEFFQLFFTAVKETYGEYCTFKEKEENLSGYSEPMFEKSIEEAGIRLASVEQQLAKANERVKELENCNFDVMAAQAIEQAYRIASAFPKDKVILEALSSVREGATDKLNKFAIEQKRIGYYDSCIKSGLNEGQASLLSDIYACFAKGGSDG